MHRRTLFRTLAGAACCCLLPRAGLAAAPASPAASDDAAASEASYFARRRDALLAAFKATNAGVAAMLAGRLGERAAKAATGDALDSFADQIPLMPPVGGERNPDSCFIPVAAWYVAYARTLRPHGLTGEDVGRIIYELNARELAARPKKDLLVEGAARFTPKAYEDGRAWAAWTQRREYPANWVAHFFEDGPDFDFGYDYTECGVVKYMRAHGVPEVAPYVCVNDFLSSRAQDTGLRRIRTLALGYDCCDFRYKQGRPVLQDWESEAPKIAARLKELKMV
ncbi:L-2-amino-thiazoline-4-carboxylic acid hydrolase [Desulfovibrio sp. X2]|uniref:L-2-amino-thiazoline-4-carboxylic acid hydrolase n=1 Tax=Desulfovibrio sp. X2 TaxID=941449 RepID=UPI000358ED4D|nr:L-2-amino-thiazoline-4-carboxylic acid hydrolase [Desulfovibrio sp. X2]EPR43411.1 L-2-amino-thiazoline-4-carboxylic acid hydrolase [Desulfovibrio sp. X2]